MFGKNDRTKEEFLELKSEVARLKAKIALIGQIIENESVLSPSEIEGWRGRQEE